MLEPTGSIKFSLKYYKASKSGSSLKEHGVDLLTNVEIKVMLKVIVQHEESEKITASNNYCLEVV